jgi:hypothetical protein
LVRDVSPCGRGTLVIGLHEGLADRGRDDGVLGARHVGEGVAHEMHAGAVEEVDFR